MPNISTEQNTNDLYKYVAELTLSFEGMSKPIILDMLYIKGIILDYKYETNNFPLMYIILMMHSDVKDLLLEHQKDGTVIFKLQKYISNGDAKDLKITCFEGKFVYVLPKSVADNGEDIENKPDDPDDIGSIHTIGMAMINHVNTSKKPINRIINKGSLSSIVNYILSGQKLVIEPLENNKTIKQTVLPPKSSISKALDYLNSLYSFYNTPYRFFMDYNMTYLLSSSKKITKAKGELYSDVIINIRDNYDEANMEGMITNAAIKAYVVNVATSFCNLDEANMEGKMYNNFTATTTNGGKSNTSLGNASGEITNKRTYMRLGNNNTTRLENLRYQSELRKLTLSITTTKIDSSIFTINKRYTINTDTTFGSKYTGEYLLVHRQDIYAPEGEGFNLNINLVFHKIPG